MRDTFGDSITIPDNIITMENINKTVITQTQNKSFTVLRCAFILLKQIAFVMKNHKPLGIEIAFIFIRRGNGSSWNTHSLCGLSVKLRL